MTNKTTKKELNVQDIFGFSWETLVADHHHKQVFNIILTAMKDSGLTNKQINEVLDKVCDYSKTLENGTNSYECWDNSKDKLSNTLTESLNGLFGEAKKLYQVYPEYFEKEVA